MADEDDQMEQFCEWENTEEDWEAEQEEEIRKAEELIAQGLGNGDLGYNKED